METEVNISASIEPGQGIGKIKLLANIITLRKLILDNLEIINPNTNVQGDWICSYNFPDHVKFSYKEIINVYCNICSGLIVRIELNMGYKGLLWNKIKPGSTVQDLINIKPDTTFDENLLMIGDDFNLLFAIDYGGEIENLDDVKSKTISQIILRNHDFESLPLGAGRIPEDWIAKMKESNNK